MIDTDFINRPSDGLRLYIAAGYIIATVKFNDIKTIGDYGCGAGGLMKFLKHNLPDKDIFGYDMVPDNVSYCKSQGLNVELKDITKDTFNFGDLVVITETLEHLSDPTEFLKKIPKGTWLIASVPCNETQDRRDPSHLHVWENDSFGEMLRECHFDIHHFDRAFICQIVVAKRRDND